VDVDSTFTRLFNVWMSCKDATVFTISNLYVLYDVDCHDFVGWMRIHTKPSVGREIELNETIIKKNRKDRVLEGIWLA
jgi:hypothetical protein